MTSNTAKLPAGIEHRLTKSGIYVTRLHYSADPVKALPQWVAEARRGLRDADWQREFEVRWDVASGIPIFEGEFQRELHVAKDPLVAIPGVTIFRCWDWGLTPACVFMQVAPTTRMMVLAEIATWDGRGHMRTQGADKLADQVAYYCARNWPDFEFDDYADPAGQHKAQSDEKTCYEIVNEKLHSWPIPGPIAFEARRQGMVKQLSKLIGGAPGIVFSPNCTMLIEGLSGAYKWDSSGEGINARYKPKPEKNAWSHPVDALMYGVGSLIYQEVGEQDDMDSAEADWAEPMANRAGLYY